MDINLCLNHEGFEANLVEMIIGEFDVQYLFKFQNGYGASIVKRPGSYGYAENLWELAVIRYDDEGEYDLEYGTEITWDVVGYQTDEEIRDLLERIKNLEEPKIEET